MNLFNLAAKLTLNTDDYNKKMSNAVSDAESKGNTIATKFKSAATTTAKVFAGMATAAAGAVGTLAKLSIDQYAQYEQLTGGVETLFKNSSNKVLDYANNAYKTAGLSANEYMETITGFTASLLQGLGGDTEKAAQIGNMAVSDMSDNANKMGTSMELIQNAYQGFAKQNYDMLDNLKLGYGGTKTEMERLLADAEKISGVKYDISNFNDVIEAIHVIQEQMGITGTTSLEAATTIEGSLNMTKAAWKNLMTGIADSNADFDTLVNNMVESASAFGNNILPRIEIALQGIGKLIEKLLPPIAEKIPAILIDILPKLVEAGANIIVKLIEGITNNLPQLITAASKIVQTIGETISKSAPQIFEGIKNAINEFVPILNPVIEGIELLVENIDLIAGALVVATSAIVAFKAVSTIQDVMRSWQEAQVQLALYSATCEGATVVQGVANGVFSLWETIVALFTGKLTLAELATLAWSKAQTVLNAVMSANPIGIVIALVTALVAGIIYLWNTNEGFREAVITAWNAIKEAGVIVWEWLVKFFTEDIPNAWENLKETLAGLPEWFKDLWNNALEKIKEVGENIKNFLEELWNKILDKIKEWGENVKQFFTETIPKMIEDIFNWFNELPGKIGYALGCALGTIIKWGADSWNYLKENVPKWIENVTTFFSELPGKIWTWLVEAYNKIVQWGSDTWNNIVTTCTNIVASVTEFFSKLPGIIWNWLTDAYTKTTTWASNMWSKAKEAGSNFIDTVVNFFSQLPGNIWSWLTNTISKVTTFASDLKRKATEAGQGFVKNIINAVKDVPTKMKEVGENIVKGVWNGIKGLGSWLTRNVKDFFGGIVKGVKDTLGIKSPSRVFMEIGAYTSEGMALGIEQNEDMVRKASESMVDTAIPNEIKVAETLNVNRSTETGLINALLNKINTDKELIINIDGREFMRAVAPYKEELDSYDNRYSFA